jgi:L-histidine Nalpha-methyltransferase / hercynylcysteine S-oxide synthase
MPSAQESVVVPNGASFGLRVAKDNGMPKLTTIPNPKLDIIDIRHAALEVNLKAEVSSMFHSKDGPRKLPTLLLYDERGLQLFEHVRLYFIEATTGVLHTNFF